MEHRRDEPERFIVLAVLILLLVGLAIFLAARLTVAPRAGETVEVTASPQVYTINDALFYPWNAYEAQDIAQLSSWAQGEDPEWYQRYLQNVPALLGLSGMEESTELGRTGAEVGFWSDCPVTTANGQPALLDVAFGRDDVNFGMTWIARSVGDLPTQAQKEAAVARVTEDVCQEFLGTPTEEDPVLWRLFLDVEVCQYNSSMYDNMASFPWFAGRRLSDMNLLFRDLYRTMAGQWGQDLQDPLEAICTQAEELNLSIQIYTGQRQVVVVYTYDAPDSKDETTLAVYYDMVLEQYSGVVLNAVEDNGK